jgi:hypothetical protein
MHYPSTQLATKYYQLKNEIEPVCVIVEELSLTEQRL